MPDERSPLLKDVECQKPRSASVVKLIAGLVGVFLASADKYILLAIQNRVATALHAPSSAPLLLVSYNLGFCIALPVYGFLSDIYGSRNFLLLAYTLFAVGCAISGAVDSLWPFVLGRFLAGIGGSGMTDLLSVLINEIFDVTEVASVRSYVIAAEIFGQGCGGPLGGLITDRIGWKWALLGQAPIGALCFVLAYFQLPQVEKKSDDAESKLRLQNFDYLGLGAFVISATSFVLGTTDGTPALDGHKQAFFTTSAIFLAILIFIERKSARPILPPSLITKPGLRSVFLMQIPFFANVSTMLTNLPTYFSQIDHLNTSQIALRIWPISGLGLILGAVIAGRFLRNAVKYRKVAIVGTAVFVISLTVVTIQWADGIQGVEVLYAFPWAVGCGIALSAQFIALTVQSPPDQMANSTAIYCLVQQVGQIVGTSGSAAALQQLFRQRLDVNLKNDLPEKAKIIHKIVKDWDSINLLPESLQTVVQSSYIQAFRLVPGLATILAIISGILIFFS